MATSAAIPPRVSVLNAFKPRGPCSAALAAAVIVTVQVLAAAAATTAHVTPVKVEGTAHVKLGVPLTVNPLMAVSVTWEFAVPLRASVTFDGEAAS